MGTRVGLWVVVGVCLAVGPVSSSAHGQGFLKRLEQRVQEVLEEPAPRRAPEEAPGDGPGYLGMTAEEDPESGILAVVAVKAGSPAQAAGVRVGDQLLALDGRELMSMDQLAGVLSQKSAGARVTLGVLRGGRKETIRVTLGERPATRPAAAPRTGTPDGGGSVLRRLERALEPAGPADDDGPPRDGARNADGEASDGDLREEVAALRQQLDTILQRLEKLEQRLLSARRGAELPDPQP